MKKILLLLLGISSINVFAENTDFNTETINKEAQYLKIVNQKGKLIVIKTHPIFPRRLGAATLNNCVTASEDTKNLWNKRVGGYTLAAESAASFQIESSCVGEFFYEVNSPVLGYTSTADKVNNSVLGYNPKAELSQRNTIQSVDRHSKIDISKSLENENGSVINVGNSGK